MGLMKQKIQNKQKLKQKKKKTLVQGHGNHTGGKSKVT